MKHKRSIWDNLWDEFCNAIIPIAIVITLIFGVWYWIPKSSPESARNALEAAGYKNIRITGTQFFGCGKDDCYRTSFTAKGQNGNFVNGVVCAGLFKGSTIRTY